MDNNVPATYATYASQIVCLKSILIDTKNMIQENKNKDSIKNITLVINSLGAYVDIQAIFDGMNFNNSEDIIKYISYEFNWIKTKYKI